MSTTNRRTRKASLELDLKGLARKTRPYLGDDREIARRIAEGETESSVLRELIHKGLSFERLKRGAGDPVLRHLLQAVNESLDQRLEKTESSIRQLNENVVGLNTNLENLGSHVDTISQEQITLLRHTNWFVAILCLGLSEGFKLPEFDRNSLAILELEWPKQYLRLVDLVLTSSRLREQSQNSSSTD